MLGALAVWTPNSSRYGGNFATVGTPGGIASVDLVVYPYLPEGNATFVLPGYNNLSRYVSNENGAGCTFSGGICGVQTPVLSWTQDGVFYVNATDRLVFYSFANHTVRDIGPWQVLYDNVLYYEGVLNSEWITADGSWVYEFGCSSSCSSSSQVEFYALNVSTGRAFSWNYTGVNDSTDALHDNAEVQMIGENGNDSLAVLTFDENSKTVSPGIMYVYDLWNHTQWELGGLPYFEANNNFWVGQLNSFIDVEAHGATGDAVSQWELAGPAPGTRLREVASSTYWDQAHAQSWIDWGGYDVTSHQISFSGGWSAGHAVDSVVYNLAWNPSDATYVIGSIAHAQYDGTYNIGVVPPVQIPATSDHRSVALADGWLTGVTAQTLYNNTVGVNPFDGQFLMTNVTQAEAVWTSLTAAGYWSGQVAGLEQYFYNDSFGITAYSVDCRDSCPVNAQNGQANGTIYWFWPAGQSEFPFPAGAALAQPLPPGPPSSVTATSTDDGGVTVDWAPPMNGQNPILNYTLLWGTSTAYGHSVNLLPSNRSFTVFGSPTGTTIYFALQAWNLHWSGPWTTGSAMVQRTSYHATFTESGLPEGAAWWINSTDGAWPSAAVTVSSGSGSTLSVVGLANGTFNFTVGVSEPDFRPVPSHGNFSVDGADVSVAPIAFSEAVYEVAFTETGLAMGTEWYMNITGASSSRSSTDTIAFPEPNGTYPWRLGAIPGYTTSPRSGIVTVDGANRSISVAWTEVTYLVTFQEGGLPSGTNWSVTLNGIPQLATMTSVSFTERNGTYSYAVASEAGYRSSPPSGSVTVSGSAVTQTITFTVLPPERFTVTFAETGLASGTNWTVTLGGTQLVSATSTLIFAEPNGTYLFAVGSVKGQRVFPSLGSIEVKGLPTSQTVSFQSSPSNGTGSSTFLGLSAIEGYALLGGIALVLVGVTAAALKRRQEKALPPVPKSPLRSGEGPPPSPPS